MNTEQLRAELLPCPFCGSTNIEIQISTPDREGVPTNLMCSDCGASGPWEYEQGNSHAKADAAWNTRASPKDAANGWILDYRFIEQVEHVARQRTDYSTSMEATEQVLIAANEVLRASQPAEPVKVRPETLSEHIARDMREGRFPGKSERKMVPAEAVREDGDALTVAYMTGFYDGKKAAHKFGEEE